MNSPWMKWITEKWQSMGPLILVELILPGGSILAFMLWLYKTKRIKNPFSTQIEKVKAIAENKREPVMGYKPHMLKLKKWEC